MLTEERVRAGPVVLLAEAVPPDGVWVGVAVAGTLVGAGEEDGFTAGFGVDRGDAAAVGLGVAVGFGVAEGFGVSEGAAEGTSAAEGAGVTLGATSGFSDGSTAKTSAGVDAGVSDGGSDGVAEEAAEGAVEGFSDTLLMGEPKGLALPNPNNRPVKNRDAKETMVAIATKKTRIIAAYFHLFFICH